MADEKKEERNGCLVIMVAILSVILALLVLMCYKKVELRISLNMPDWISSEGDSAQTETDPTVGPETKPQETKPKETKPKETKPKETTPKETQPVETKPQKEEPAVTISMRVVSETAAFAEASSDSAVIASFDLGSVVEIVGEKREFSITKVDGVNCYIPTKYLRDASKHLVVIDAGHQAKGNREQEPVGPGATETKAKVTSGAQGVNTQMEEYELNLLVAKRVQKLLEDKGYQVKMIRTDNDVDISNAERAKIANDLCADAFIRIHANSDEDPEKQGVLTICQTEGNPYNGNLYTQCRELSECLLDKTAAAAGAKKRFVWETDTMSGINWCKVPVTIVEMGYMSNPEEDELLATEAYQKKLAQGIADGVDYYFRG